MQNKEFKEEYHLLPLMLRRKTLYRENILELWVEHTISERHNNTQQYFNYLIRGSLRKLYKYPVKPRKY